MSRLTNISAVVAERVIELAFDDVLDETKREKISKYMANLLDTISTLETEYEHMLKLVIEK